MNRRRKLVARPRELRQRVGVEPRLVVGVGIVVEVVKGALGRVGIAVRGTEPLVRDAGVVGGEVADDMDAPGVRRLDQPAVGVVAAEQRVDRVEPGGVVAMVRLGREDRGVVQRGRAEVGDVVEAFGGPVEVAAVQLAAAPRMHRVERFVPCGRDRPVGRRARVGRRRAGEPVGEDLVQDRVVEPGRRGIVGDEGEVLAVEGVDVAEAALVQDLDPAVRAHEVEAVAVARIRDPDDGAPPLPPVRSAVADGVDPGRLVVGVRADDDTLDRTVPARHAEPHDDVITEARRRVRDVQRRAVVVRPHLTDPAVRPPTMKRCRLRKRAIGRIAASTAPAAKTLQLRAVSCETNW